MMMARFFTLSLPFLLLACCGCGTLASSWHAISPFVNRPVVADTQNPVVEVACMWEPGEGRNPKGVPARGFAGQIYFFTQNHSEPVFVNGDVRVYLFADRGTPEERARPLHQFDFKADAWKTHASQTSFGPGYNVFIPYPKHEPYQVRCQLRVRFQPENGAPVWSESLATILDGPPAPSAEPVQWMMGNQPTPPATNQISIHHERVTPNQQTAQASAEPASTLRVDTFGLDAIQQAAFNKQNATAASAGKIETANWQSEPNDPNAPPASTHPRPAQTAASTHPLANMSPEDMDDLIARLLQSRGDQSTLNLANPPGAPDTTKQLTMPSPHPLAARDAPATTPTAPHPINSVSNAASNTARLAPGASAPSADHILEEPEPTRHSLKPAAQSQSRDEWKPTAREGQAAHPRTQPAGRYFPKPRPNRALQHQEGRPIAPHFGVAPPTNGERWTRTATAQAAPTDADAQKWRARTLPSARPEMTP